MKAIIVSYNFFILTLRATAFIQPLSHVSILSQSSNPSLLYQPFPSRFFYPQSTSFVHRTQSSTNLNLYNLPPDNNNNNNNKNDLGSFIPSIVSVLALGLFFFSPLGALFFALTNTLIIFSFLAPFVLYAGFQIWQYLYTLEGTCPNCGSAVRVLKDVQQPTICFNCGSQVISNTNMDGVDLYDDNDDVDSIMDRQRTIWDTLFSNNEEQGFPSYDSKETLKRTRREQTIIDVDVSDE